MFHNTNKSQLGLRQSWFDLKLGITQWIKQIHGDPSFNQRNAPLNDFLERQLLFVTAHAPSRSDHLVEFEKMLFGVMKATIGNKLGRKGHLQPRVFAFLDTPASGKNIKRDIRECPNRHVHALIVSRIENADAIYNSFRELSQSGRNDDIQSDRKRLLDVQRFNREKGTVQKLVGYCIKGLTATPPDTDLEMWVHLPRGTRESVERGDSKRFQNLLDDGDKAAAKERCFGDEHLYCRSPQLSEARRAFLYGTIIPPELKRLDHEPIDPWTLTAQDKFDAAAAMPCSAERRDAWRLPNVEIGDNNRATIDQCDAVFVVLAAAPPRSDTHLVWVSRF